MASTLKDIRARVAALLSDPDQDSLTPAYLTPLTNQVYESQISYLAGTCNPFETKLVTVSNLAIGTADLTNLQRTGALLGLVNPLELRWKQAGQPENFYLPLRRFNVLPQFSPAQSVSLACSTQAGWEWRGNVVYMTPFAFAVDLRVRGEFSPPPLCKDDDVVQVHPQLGHALAYGTAALAAIERGNPEWVQSYGALAQSTLNEIANQMMRQQQRTTFRAGKLNGRRR